MPDNLGSGRSSRVRMASVLALLVLVPLLSGCVVVDFFTPVPDATDAGSDTGHVRFWVAAEPGALGDEFAHLNLTFGPVGIAGDMFLGSIVPLVSAGDPVDLIALERHRKAAMIAEGYVALGEYFGYTYSITSVVLGERRLAGNHDGTPVYRVDERELAYTPRTISLRAEHLVNTAGTIDLYLEANLVRSLSEEDGVLSFTLVPAGTSIYLNGLKADQVRYDGGAGELGLGNNPPNGYGSRWEDTDNFNPPFSIIDIEEPGAEDRFYSGTRVISKRVTRAIGLGEDLVFDGGRSVSRVGELGETGGQAPIVEYAWDFGDGTSFRSARPTVVKNYTSGGLFDVVLTVTDSFGLSASDHVTLFVPYTSDQLVDTRVDSRAGTLYAGSATVPTDTTVDTAGQAFVFPADIEGGDLRLGGYRVTLQLFPPAGVTDTASARLVTTSGHLQHSVIGYGNVETTTAGIPSWRAALSKWVDTTLDVDVELVTGALVEYDLRVEALYYQNLSRGLDPHAAHMHGEWLFGPKFEHLDHEGLRRIDEA